MMRIFSFKAIKSFFNSLSLFYLFFFQIVRTQIKRFWSNELIEYDKNVNSKDTKDDDGVK